MTGKFQTGFRVIGKRFSAGAGVSRISRVFLLGILMPALFLALPGGAEEPGLINLLYPYPPPEEMLSEIAILGESFPERVRIFEYGKSVQGRPLVAFLVSRDGEEANKPAALIAACIHGNEWIGNRMAMAAARLLLEQDGKDQLITEALDNMSFYFAPCLNPDGYFRTWHIMSGRASEMDKKGAGNKSGEIEIMKEWVSGRKNARGVDLNRNFPLPGKLTIPIDWAGSPAPESAHYRGPHPLSEPETMAIDRFMAEHPEVVTAVSWHSYGGVMFPAHCPSRACMKRYKKMCRAFREYQPKLGYPRLQSRVFDTYTGEMEDWLYAQYGVLAVDIEIGRKSRNQKACNCKELFWTYNPKNPEWWIENDARAAIAAALEAVRITGGARIPEPER